MNAPSPAPWKVESTHEDGWKGLGIRAADGMWIANLVMQPGPENERTNGRLMATAPDHALLLRAVIEGRARWEPFPSGAGAGEICVGGLRHVVQLDEFGCPQLAPFLREALTR